MYILTVRDATNRGAKIETLTWNKGDDETPKSDEAEAKAMALDAKYVVEGVAGHSGRDGDFGVEGEVEDVEGAGAGYGGED
ncbi:hypothetical protein H2203_009312 [Taxawa tesnikishii (nom. ined.)]|nr:hypothetical protein H2203_009312 [Dothideales sp. JES 119]